MGRSRQGKETQGSDMGTLRGKNEKGELVTRLPCKIHSFPPKAEAKIIKLKLNKND